MMSAMDIPASSFRPTGALAPNPLAAYRGPWTVRQAAHLARRAGFGGSPADIARIARMSMPEAVDAFVTFAPTPKLPAAPTDMPDESDIVRQLRERPMARAAPGAPGLTVVELRKQRRALEREGVLATQRWWLDRMLATPAPLQEKMTLFWHGHFTTAAIQKGVLPAEVVTQNTLFRSYALGDIRELTQRVAVDPAMLKYLDNLHNEAAHPNENFARELMELYTLGIGNYTEADVREAARAWTGVRLRRATGEVFVNAALHDSGTKTFLGRSGNFGGSDIVTIIFEQPAAARYFATKVLAFFVYSEPEPELVEAVATLLRKNNFVLAPVMRTLLSSNVFYSERAYRALVKSPVEFVVGTYQLFGIAQVEPMALAALRRMTQVLFYPPNVKGWPGGSAWLNSSTLLARENFANAVMTSKVVDGSAHWLTATGPGNPAAAAQSIVDTIVQGDASPASLARLQAYLGGADTAALGALSGENFDQRMRGGAYLTMAMPAYQLA